ncbi:MAG: glycosyltransferase family 4 protein [Candidatus Omnitrophica bacterium]|nr:glycosyltransferase family 4 protein [Candidatus Omnitrophota bacterium]
MKILFISPVPVEGAGCRFRIYQYFPYLKEHNIKVKLSPFLFSSYFNIVYKPGKVFLKIIYFFFGTLRRFYDLVRASGYDIIFVYRESYPVGPPIFEYILHFLGKPIICDFDDAIFLPNTSRANRFLRLWRRHHNIDKIIQLSDCVITGNDYLKNYALKFHKNVSVLPTVIDPNRYIPATGDKHSRNEKLVIGWIGSATTQDYLVPFIPIFKKLTEKYKDIFLKIVSNNFAFPEKLNNSVIFQEWSLKSELEDLQSFDIGIMPMPDNNWTRGKCGFKAILYMSISIPVVCSPVGANTKIIQDGVNGFLANSDEEWLQKLSQLIEDPGLRDELGRLGRKTVEENFSLNVNSLKLLGVLEKVYYESKEAN